MASEKFLFVDAAGNATEDKASVTVFAGTASADSLVKTNASGKIDNTLINFAAFDRYFSVRVAANSNITISAPGAAIDGTTLNAGDRVLLFGQTDQTTNGIYVFNGSAVAMTRALDYDENAEIHAGDLVIVNEGTTFHDRLYLLITNDTITIGTTNLVFNALGTNLIDAGTALSYSGTTLNVNVTSLGGLQVVSNSLKVQASAIAGLGLVGNADTTHVDVDFVVTGTNNNSSRAVKGSDLIGVGASQGAKIIGYDNTLTSAYTTATTAQQAIDDAFSYAQAPGVLYTVGTGGVTKGQLVYVSANNTVLPYTNISVAHEAIGIAATTVAAGSPVKVVEVATVLTAVLSSATVDGKIYWNGSGFTQTMPSALGSYVWVAGRAKNASDLHVKVEFLKRNSLV